MWRGVRMCAVCGGVHGVLLMVGKGALSGCVAVHRGASYGTHSAAET